MPAEAVVCKLITDKSLDKVRANRAQTRFLSATRDSLLPKLLSGEVRVKEAEAV